MRLRTFALIALGLAVHGASAAEGDQRPELKDVSTVRIANYNTPSTVIKNREQVKLLVDELRQLRNKAWRRGNTKLSCYATLVLLSGTRTVALFRVRPEFVVERWQKKGQSSYSLAIGQDDAPGLIALLAQMPPPKDCN